MFTASSIYGAQPQAPSAGVAGVLEPMGITSDDQGGVQALVNPRNPLVAFGVLLLLTAGLIGASGSVRLGKATFRASAGKE